MFQVRLERIRRLSASTLDFRFVTTEGVSLRYKPGQFFRFVFTDDAGEFERSYSLCNFDGLYGKELDLVISGVPGGRATRYLFNATEGVTAAVTGPYGRLVVPDILPARLVMVATSVGIAPYMPMLRQLEEPLQAGQLEVVLVFGMRDSSEFLYAEQLLGLQQKYSGFKLIICCSRETPEGKQYEPATVVAGYVTDQFDALYFDPGKDHVLLCGNPAMVEAGWVYLREKGFKPAQVIREKYVFARGRKSGKPTAMSEEHKRLLAEKMKQHQR